MQISQAYEIPNTLVKDANQNSFLELFSKQVKKNPNHPALKMGNSTLTYKELNDKADQLAYNLLAMGVSKDQLVNLLLPRSIELIISILGTLKAGGAYVPLSPKDGPARINHIIKDTLAPILITQEAFIEEFSVNSILSVDLNRGEDWINPIKIGALEQQKSPLTYPVAIDPNSLAYIIYTSGTTGEPKGVMIEHRNLYSYLMNFRPTIDANDRTLQSMSTTCDSSVAEIFPTLANGATLILWKEDLSKTLREEKITYTNLTPSMVTLIDSKDCLHLKKIIIGGENLTPEAVKKFPSEVSIYNGYGPTEGTVDASVTKIKDPDSIHIGESLPHVQFFVVDEKGKVSKAGEEGELWIGGQGIARGYLNKPELTAEKFITNPFGGGKIYKTGDKVIWTAPGILKFLGRIDRQVKVRGHRLELDGIEKIISELPEVKSAHTKVLNHNLVGYITPKNIDTAKLILLLKEKLPHFAIPNKLVSLESFPLNSAGKVDSDVLPDPFLEEKKGASPRSKEEKEMAILWHSVLFANKDQRKILLKDNFFDIGGTSLHVLKLMGKLRVIKDNMDLPIELLYNSPSFESFCQAVKEFSSKKEELTLVNNDWGTHFVDFLKALPSTLFFNYCDHFKIFLYVGLGVLWPPFLLYYPLELFIFKVLKLRPPKFFLKLKYSLNFEKFYFKNIEIIEDSPIENNPSSVYCVHPHGATDYHLIPITGHLNKKRPGFHQTDPGQAFYLPIAATQCYLGGFVPAEEKSYHWAKKNGVDLMTTPGDSSEYFTAKNSDTITLTPNKVFFKIALKSGLPLTPIYVYHQHGLFKFYKNAENLKHKNKFFNLLIQDLVFRGRYGLPIPFKKDLKIVIGKPIQVKQKDHPTWDEVEALCDTYANAFRHLFEKYRPVNYPDLEII